MNKKGALKVFIFTVILVFSMNGASVYSASVYKNAMSTKKTAPAVKADAVDYSVSSYQQYCEALNKAASEFKESVKITVSNYDKKTYESPDIVEQLEIKYGNLFYLKTIDYSWVNGAAKNSVIMTVKFSYKYPKDKLQAMTRELGTRTDAILKNIISYDMTLSDKELAIHDYVAKNVRFDKSGEQKGSYAEESYSPYGALIKGTANSIGYARAMQMLMSKVGIENIIVYGKDNTWNMVKLDGEYYHVDACGDNIEEKDGRIIVVHDYFNISDEEMSKKSVWDRGKYPKSSSMKANYFQMNNTFVDSPKGFYNVLKDGIDDVRDIISVKIKGYNENLYDLYATLGDIIDDYPDLDYIDFSKTEYYSDDELGILNVVMVYDQPKEKLFSMKNQVKEKVDQVAKSIIKPGMTDYEKEKTIHDYIIFNAKYNKAGAEKNDVPFEEHDAYGVLIKGIGVCDSYAEAFKMLLDKAGVESIIVIGDQKDGKDDNIGHAWNMVKLGGKYYHVDVTWDDREYDDGQNDLTYDYFNLTDERMAKDHIWNTSDYPSCTSTDENYFYKNGKVVNNRSQAESLLRSSAGNGEVVVDMLITDFSSGRYDIRGMISKVVNNRTYRIKKATWTTNDIQGVVKITFEYY
ncbi:MAG: transglutaminase domain-containing protein [Caulobacteraceae bacterium]